jgi:molecular chaperone DnaJ
MRSSLRSISILGDESRAYETLSDEKKRKIYDSGVDPDSQVPPPGWDQGGFQGYQDFNQAFSGFDFDFIFGSMGESFRQSRTQQRDVQRNYDITVGLKVSFMEAIKGVTKNVTYERIEMCQSCKGKGGKNGTGRVNCTQCRGRGMRSSRRANIIYSTTCSHCGGAGSVLEDPCK